MGERVEPFDVVALNCEQLRLGRSARGLRSSFTAVRDRHSRPPAFNDEGRREGAADAQVAPCDAPGERHARWAGVQLPPVADVQQTHNELASTRGRRKLSCQDTQ
jgi:hypothetical protein